MSAYKVETGEGGMPPSPSAPPLVAISITVQCMGLLIVPS